MSRPLLLFAAILLSAATILLIASLLPTAWDGLRPATCIQTGCFCEAADTRSPIRQTANTFSSLGYVFSGALAMTRNERSRRFPFLYAIIFGLSSILVGIGSAFYHASLTFIGQFFDVLGMFMLATFMLVYAFERIWTLRLMTTFGLYLTIALFLGWMQFSLPDTRRYVFAIILVIALLFEAHYRRKKKPNLTVKPLQIGIVLLAVAYIIWILDNSRILCLETSLIQGHALWHLLGAVSVWLLYEYYSSEKN